MSSKVQALKCVGFIGFWQFFDYQECGVTMRTILHIPYQYIKLTCICRWVMCFATATINCNFHSVFNHKIFESPSKRHWLNNINQSKWNSRNFEILKVDQKHCLANHISLVNMVQMSTNYNEQIMFKITLLHYKWIMWNLYELWVMSYDRTVPTDTIASQNTRYTVDTV